MVGDSGKCRNKLFFKNILYMQFLMCVAPKNVIQNTSPTFSRFSWLDFLLWKEIGAVKCSGFFLSNGSTGFRNNRNSIFWEVHTLNFSYPATRRLFILSLLLVSFDVIYTFLYPPSHNSFNIHTAKPHLLPIIRIENF